MPQIPYCYFMGCTTYVLVPCRTREECTILNECTVMHALSSSQRPACAFLYSNNMNNAILYFACHNLNHELLYSLIALNVWMIHTWFGAGLAASHRSSSPTTASWGAYDSAYLQGTYVLLHICLVPMGWPCVRCLVIM